ncbi:MAG: hypothetical protein J6386_23070 [Candidatus Synoicihabitans palmerolidicus]|nr:hypothetical protein [Candidatus Synoicihabitans palmerolidicus]
MGAWLRREGVKVAPFKAQNMSNNAWALSNGLEMARAQAEACGVEPCVEMNPISLKPTTEKGAQLVLKGRVVTQQDGRDYYRNFDRLWANGATCWMAGDRAAMCW